MSKEADATPLVDDVIRAAAYFEPELEEALAQHGLTRPSYLVLTTLLDAPERRLRRARARPRRPPRGDRHADRPRARARRGRPARVRGDRRAPGGGTAE